MSADNPQHHKIKKPTLVVVLLIVLALIVFLASLAVLVRESGYLFRSGAFSSLHHPRQWFSRRVPPDYSLRRQQEAAQIREWMTFSFINRVFGLPPAYLQTKIAISDKKCPNISINAWAKQTNQDVQKLTEQIKTLIYNYQSPTPTSAPSTQPSASI